MSETRTEVRLTATIKRGPYGLWYVRVAGNGYTSEHAIPDECHGRVLLTELVEDGFVLVDPLHYCELHDLFDEPISQYEDSRDAAEAPAVAMAGRLDQDAGIPVDEYLPW